jgi:NADH-quinone oxidoreductase subunit G
MAYKAATSIGVIKDGWNGFNILHTAAGRVGALDVCALPGDGGMNTNAMLKAAAGKSLDVLFLVGADEIDTKNLGNAFVVYVGSHGDAGAQRADVVLPGAAYTEKSATYVNTEGRAQMTTRAAFPPGDAKEDWAIIRALSESLGATLPWNNLEELRAAMYKIAPQLASLDQVHKADATALVELAQGAGKTTSAPFQSPVRDFYFTNPIARASRTMAECSALKNGRTLQAAE